MTNTAPRTAVDHHVDKAKDYVQNALDGGDSLLTPDQWIEAAKVQATLALARATERRE